jgi:hypothetical protein
MAKIIKPIPESAGEPAADAAQAPALELKDAFTQIREARDRIVAAVIARALAEGSYQHAKWLFELGGIVPAGQTSPEDEPSLVRLLLDQFHIPEDDDQSNGIPANDHAVE